MVALTPDIASASAEIYRRWRRFVSAEEARRQAADFARRFHMPIDGALARPVPITEAELDSMLQGIANAMGEP
jgi:hypothetical protein